ncbi:large ribosomal subunit protein eL14-like [Clavelina lepadiformis]|uniref:Large ribosomal subunit protein eL14 n=1 Tax=Clavelina lepadiformis TaxID=159417 RepID=A0ABP0GZ37_CLALP
MVYKKFVEIGTVVYITLGPNSGKLAAIVNVVDQNRLLVDGPCSSVPRCVVNLKQIQLTKFRITIPFGSRTGTVKKAWEKENVNAQWEETTWAKKIALKQKKASLSDFDRFKVMKLKQKRSRIISAEVAKLKKQQKST